jgi:hypothetical protein
VQQALRLARGCSAFVQQWRDGRVMVSARHDGSDAKALINPATERKVCCVSMRSKVPTRRALD